MDHESCASRPSGSELTSTSDDVQGVVIKAPTHP